jgi:uncharacterized protein YcnI
MMVAAAGLLALPAMAAAHVTYEPATGPSDGFVLGDFIVPHGCDGSPTTKVQVKVPDTVPLATPGRNPFYDLSVKEGPKQKVELFGETVTEGVSEVTWTANQPLPEGQIDKLGLEVKLPAGEPGEVLYFPTLQTCANGEVLRWVQIPAEGQDPEELEEPAPAIELAAAEEDHHGGGGEEHVEASETDDDDGAPAWLTYVAVALGAAGLAFGGVAFARSRGSA